MRHGHRIRQILESRACTRASLCAQLLVAWARRATLRGSIACGPWRGGGSTPCVHPSSPSGPETRACAHAAPCSADKYVSWLQPLNAERKMGRQGTQRPQECQYERRRAARAHRMFVAARGRAETSGGGTLGIDSDPFPGVTHWKRPSGHAARARSRASCLSNSSTPGSGHCNRSRPKTSCTCSLRIALLSIGYAITC